MDTLVTYLKNHLDELVDDAVSSLRLGGATFGNIESNRLREALRDVTWHFVLFAEERGPHHLETCCRAFVSLWDGAGGRPSDAVDFFCQLEDLVVVRVVPAPGSEEDHFDDIRYLRSLTRQVMGAVADRLADDGQAGSVNSGQKPLAVDLSLTMDETLRPAPSSVPPGAGGRPGASGIALMESHARSRFVGRKEELRTIWARLRAVTGEGSGHQVVGLRGAPGTGRTTLAEAFVGLVGKQLGATPSHVVYRGSRLRGGAFWGMANIVREALALPWGQVDEAARFSEAIDRLAALGPRLPVDSATLLEAKPYLSALIGCGGVESVGSSLTARGRLRRGLVALFEALSLRARQTTRGPLFVTLADLNFIDAPSLAAVVHLVEHVRPIAPLMLLVSYGEGFEVPVGLGKGGLFTEFHLEGLSRAEGDKLIDTQLVPNRISAKSRKQLMRETQGVPLRLIEAIRARVGDGTLIFDGTHWTEAAGADGASAAFDTLVERRAQGLNQTTQRVLQIVAATEELGSRPLLEAVLDREGLGREVLRPALERLVSVRLVDEGSRAGIAVPRCVHPLMRAQVRARLDREARRLLHESVADTLRGLPLGRAFPRLVAEHFDLAEDGESALSSVLAAIERAAAFHELDDALGDVATGRGLLEEFSPDEAERARAALGRWEARLHSVGRDVEARRSALDALSGVEPASEVGREVALMRAAAALDEGRYGLAEDEVLPLLSEGPESPQYARVRMILALAGWQQNRVDEARIFLDEAIDGVDQDSAPALWGRLHALRARVLAPGGNVQEAIYHAFEAWRVFRRGGDAYGEALAVADLAELYWSMGRLLDANQLLELSLATMSQLELARPRARVMNRLGRLHELLGDVEAAASLFAEVHGDETADSKVGLAAGVGRGRALTELGRYVEATKLLADVWGSAERAGAPAVALEAQVALADSLSQPGRKKSDWKDALEQAEQTERGGQALGLDDVVIQSGVIRVRTLTSLGDRKSAEEALDALDTLFGRLAAQNSRLAVHAARVAHARCVYLQACGDKDGLVEAAKLGWSSVRHRWLDLRQSNFARPFVEGITVHRQLAEWGQVDLAEEGDVNLENSPPAP